jgi:hypothetical protein
VQIIRLTALIFLVLGASACREEEQGRTLSFDKTYSGTPMPLIDNKVGDKLRQRVAMQDF